MKRVKRSGASRVSSNFYNLKLKGASMRKKEFNYVHFYVYSTGYVPNSNPPKFDQTKKKLMEQLGSFGRVYFDGRFGWQTLYEEALEYVLQCRPDSYAFKIVGKNGMDSGIIITKALAIPRKGSPYEQN